MGLHLDLYRSTYYSPANILAGWQRVTVTNVEGPFEPSLSEPGVILDRNGHGNPVIRPDMEWMHDHGSFAEVPSVERMAFGGAYAATTDSRFGEALRTMGTHGYFAVPVHDYSFTLEGQR